VDFRADESMHCFMMLASSDSLGLRTDKTNLLAKLITNFFLFSFAVVGLLVAA